MAWQPSTGLTSVLCYSKLPAFIYFVFLIPSFFKLLIVTNLRPAQVGFSDDKLDQTLQGCMRKSAKCKEGKVSKICMKMTYEVLKKRRFTESYFINSIRSVITEKSSDLLPQVYKTAFGHTWLKSGSHTFISFSNSVYSIVFYRSNLPLFHTLLSVRRYLPCLFWL